MKRGEVEIGVTYPGIGAFRLATFPGLVVVETAQVEPVQQAGVQASGRPYYHATRTGPELDWDC